MQENDGSPVDRPRVTHVEDEPVPGEADHALVIRAHSPLLIPRQARPFFTLGASPSSHKSRDTWDCIAVQSPSFMD